MNTINAVKFISEGASIISLDKEGEPSSVSLEYSNNGTDWSTWDLSGLTVNSGDALYIRGNNPSGFNSSPEAYYTFVIEGDNVSCSGNIMSLIDYKNLLDVIPCDYCFYGLFSRCSALTTAPELPAMALADWCYSFMFYGCSSLKAAPELPASRITDYCYCGMFEGCTSLTSSPELPTNNSKLYYMDMFDGCKFKIALY